MDAVEPEDEFERLAVVPQLDLDGTPYVLLQWGEQQSKFTTDDARAAGLMLIECALDAELQAVMARWLLEQDGATQASVASIVLAFRRYRHGITRTTDPEGDPVG